MPTPQRAREVIAEAVALRASRLGSTTLGGRHAIVNASISGPKPYTDFLTKVESDVYCLKFTLKELVFNLDGNIDTFAHVRAENGTVSVVVKSPKAINLAGCLPEFTAFPELEKYNAIRDKRRNIFGF